jgi:2-methylcitrate dehydratase PrpD
MSMAQTDQEYTARLADFVADLRFDDLSPTVVERTKDLCVDWVASALAGRQAAPVQALARFAATIGPTTGPSSLVGARRCTSPFFAALVNAAASHVVEQDDLHNASVFHPGTVVFPAVVAAAQELGASGRAVVTGAVAGYEVGARVGMFLGRSHYRVFHTTGTAGTLAAAAGVASILGLDARRVLHTLGSAGTQAAGLWEFLRDAADSKQLHTAKAAADGLLAAYLARDGFTGARRILEGAQGMGAAMSTDAKPDLLIAGLGETWAITQTSFKFHASCRHTHPAADALLEVMAGEDLSADQIARVRACVHQAALDVLGPATEARTIHQAKFSMGFVLACIAVYGHAGVTSFNEQTLRDPHLREFAGRVEMVLDPEVDSAYPARWLGKVMVETRDGREFSGRVEVPRGDPGNGLTRQELREKAHHLAAFGGDVSAGELDILLDRLWALDMQGDIRDLFDITRDAVFR